MGGAFDTRQIRRAKTMIDFKETIGEPASPSFCAVGILVALAPKQRTPRVSRGPRLQQKGRPGAPE